MNREWDSHAIGKSFEQVTGICHSSGVPPIRPIESAVEGAGSEIPLLLPAVQDEALKPLLLSWYYAGYYTGRYQALKERS